jgi:hypothetical protein
MLAVPKRWRLRIKKYFAAASAMLIAATVTAQPRWNQVTPGNMEWSNAPNQRSTTIYNQVGPLTFGSNGSRGYTTGNTTIVTTPDGNQSSTTRLGETTYLRGADGKVVQCKRYGENVFCD